MGGGGRFPLPAPSPRRPRVPGRCPGPSGGSWQTPFGFGGAAAPAAFAQSISPRRGPGWPRSARPLPAPPPPRPPRSPLCGGPAPRTRCPLRSSRTGTARSRGCHSPARSAPVPPAARPGELRWVRPSRSLRRAGLGRGRRGGGARLRVSCPHRAARRSGCGGVRRATARCRRGGGGTRPEPRPAVPRDIALRRGPPASPALAAAMATRVPWFPSSHRCLVTSPPCWEGCSGGPARPAADPGAHPACPGTPRAGSVGHGHPGERGGILLSQCLAAFWFCC